MRKNYKPKAKNEVALKKYINKNVRQKNNAGHSGNRNSKS
tara:strand:- start:1849 stop:1968 length:120 start_codon:yes stop_codon:yes gene_type:complete